MNGNELIYTARMLGRIKAIDLGIHTLTWNQARRMLLDGRMSQDSFDLFDDLWNVSATRFSISQAEISQSEANLIVRFEKELVQIAQGRNENVNG
ncbi:MAG: hypothetical protein ACXADB_11560 [Candidatus Hermodarchaeia archaeon]|jgi:hypothetical protein